jgi:beta-lactamase class A
VTFDPAGSARYVGKLAATDMLINLVGRSAVEAALMEAGMVNPSLNRPFLTTRETFILTFEQWPALANRYRAAKEAGRRALLANTVDRIPLPDVAAMRALSTRGEVGSLGWFASATTSAVPTPPWPPSPADRACPRSARCFRSTTTASSSIRLSGK